MKGLLFKYILLVAAAIAVRGMVHAQTAQNYPVSITPVIYPPYPPSIKFLNAASSPSLVLSITNKSLNTSVLNVRLAVGVSCAAFTAWSKPVVTGLANISIPSSGVPVMLNNMDIAAAYAFNNLTGLTLSQYENALPETRITYSFVLYDAVTGRQVSDIVTYDVINSLNNPPVTTLPEEKAEIVEKGMQSVLFQWQPRQLTAGGAVRYVFELIELLDKTQNAQSAFITNRPIFTDSTLFTRYVYGPDLPPLIPGKAYAWRVQAKSFDYGGNQVETFRYQGYSNVASFFYTAPCKQPGLVKAENIDRESADIMWTSLQGYDNFLLQYRKKGTDAWQNFSVTNSGTQYSLAGLLATTSYEVQVKAICPNNLEAVSSLYTFTTTDKEAGKKISASCGKKPETKQLSEVLLAKLQPKDVFTVGDYTVEVSEGVSGSNGYFTGKGIIEVWLGKAFKMPVSFERIKINKDYQVLDGKVVPVQE